MRQFVNEAELLLFRVVRVCILEIEDFRVRHRANRNRCVEVPGKREILDWEKRLRFAKMRHNDEEILRGVVIDGDIN